MAILGAHKSIAGGLDKAVLRARASGCDCLQVFTRNNTQWAARPIHPDEATRFRKALQENAIGPVVAHANYLINLAGADRALRRRSIDAMVVEIERAETLAIPHVVVHPGSWIEGGEAVGIRRAIDAVGEVLDRTAGLAAGVLLETTAGQGTSLGCRFEHLAALLAGVGETLRLGVCFDTCHVFAAGYPLRTAAQYRRTMAEFDRLVGLGRIRVFHLNDSRRERGSRVDRHEHIGRGKLGLAAFRNLLNDRRFRRLPMLLETPKDEGDGLDADAVNLARLRGLVGRRPSRRQR